MRIGNLEIQNGIFLAPMAGVTDKAFRAMCKKYSAGCMTTEMVSAKAICYGDKKTGKLAQIYDYEAPCGLQLFGSEPEILGKAAIIVAEKYKPAFIDINMGCPAPKIVNNGEGSALMKSPELCGKIVDSVKKAVGDFLPVTVKIRSGFDRQSVNALEVARICEQSGADCIFVHGRTRDQMYMPPVDYSVIKSVKESVTVPVIANGDITDGKTALSVLEQTGCDGVMIGRASLGNPYVFDEVDKYLSSKPYTPPQKQTVQSDIKEHINLLIEDKGEYVGVREARKHVAWYIKGMPGAAGMRNAVNLAETQKEIMDIIDRAFSL